MLVIGASGIVGRAALEHFSQLPGWRTIGLSRRAPDLPNVEHIALDLQNAEACERLAPQLFETTHVIYAALFETFWGGSRFDRCARARQRVAPEGTVSP